MKDKNDKIKRKAIASLGEYLFYAATQLDDENADACWNIEEDAISTIIRALKPIEDSVVRLYACKTLENITAQSNSAGHKFATLETVKGLLEIFLCQENSELFKTSAAVALSHIVKLNCQFFPIVFDKMGSARFCYVLAESQGRVQQAFITMLNLALSNGGFPKITDVLLKDRSFLEALVKMIDHTSIVIRGKCLLTFLLLFK